VGDRRCKLFVSDVHGTKYELRLTGVERLRADNFLEGNVILDVAVRSRVRLNDKYLLWVLSLDESTSRAYRAAIDGKPDRIAEGNLCLVQVSSSYGCTFESVCAYITADVVSEDTEAAIGL